MTDLPPDHRIAHNGREGSQRRWYVHGPSPAQQGIDPDDHEQPVVSHQYFNRAALHSAIQEGTWHVGDSPKAKHTPAEKEWARNKMQQWADDDSDVKRKVNEVFNDRRTNG